MTVFYLKSDWTQNLNHESHSAETITVPTMHESI